MSDNKDIVDTTINDNNNITENNVDSNNNSYNIYDNNNSVCNERIYIKVPKINKLLKKQLNSLIHECLHKSKKVSLGVIKFINNNFEYIHCPIKKINSKGIVKIGVCRHFKPLVNCKEARRKLTVHKFQYHYKSKKGRNDWLKINLKTNKSLEEELKKY